MRTPAYTPGDPVPADHLLFERELACFRRQLFSAALRMTGNPSDAEDLVQETMTRAYAGLRRFTPGTNGRAWLYRIMANVFFSACRKRQHEPVQVLSPELDVPHGAAAQALVSGMVSSSPSAEEEVLGQLAHSEFRDVLAELPECLKATIYLADVEGYSHRDVADMIGVPIGTVMSRLHRARTRLRSQLGACLPPMPATESVAD